MNSVGTLVGVRFVGAQKPLVHALGLGAAIFLNECLFWQAKVGEGEWFSRTIPQMFEETGLSKSEQATIRKELVKKELIEERKGVQYRTQTRVNVEEFNRFLDTIQPLNSSRLEDSAAQNLSASRSIPDGSYNSHSNSISKESELAQFPVSLKVVEYAQFAEEGINTPWKIWESYCKAMNRSSGYLTGELLQRQLHIAKLIVKDGITEGDTHACALWLNSDEWWKNKGVTLNDVRNQYPRWVGLGKPPAQKAVGMKQIRGSTPMI